MDNRFLNQRHLDDFIDYISVDKQNKAEIICLLLKHTDTVKYGFKDRGNYRCEFQQIQRYLINIK